ncbi:hypothetical protein ABVK25_011348 [Lepraria finkii]|uniref:DNA replication checkpoint mediator MRC1 domain-containing protein n=1 Tax=Lepraria finkii TaxID=1340010 RepID=A0ABR4AWD2_9LECA
MADTQGQADEVDDEQDSLAFLGPPPEPNFPMFDVNDSPQMIEDSQTGLQHPNAVKDQDANSYKDIELNFSQSQIRYDAFGDTQAQPTATQVSEIPDPTQDVGFTLSSPAPERFVSVPPSTVDTVLLSGAADNESPIKKRRGRLQRGAVIHENVSDLDEVLTTSDGQDAERDVPTNAFEAMKKAGKKDLFTNNDFDKKKSEAKTMVEEQAQESEDEYAGLGGASDDESGGEEDEFVREMIDQGEVNVDENQLAAFYANKERTSDEKAVEKLFKDINSGMLRRKRGAEFDISDSEDDAEARQRRKRREFAKMRKALLENENVGKIAEDPKKLAFLRAIEDREDDEDLDFLDRPAEDSFRIEVDTQEEADSQSQQPTLPGPALGKRKRPLQESIPDKANMRPPPAARRTAASKKPATLAEIRESVSFLIEEPGSINIAPDPSSSASEDEDNHSGNRQSNPRRRLNPKTIIDRLSLKRAESASTSSPSRLAFHDPSSNSSIGGFKVPSLLRRATTSNLDTNAVDANGISIAAATERAAGGGEKGDFVRKGGTKRSSVNYFSREAEKRGVVEGVERRRKEEREREARKRRSGLGSLGVGAFE